MATSKRAGSRRGAKPAASFNGPSLLLALAITGFLIAWGYLVYLAIDFGTSARAGQPAAWGLLALSALGAVACLFAGLLLVSRLLRTLGISSAEPDEPADPTIETPPVRVPGGRRALR